MPRRMDTLTSSRNKIVTVVILTFLFTSGMFHFILNEGIPNQIDSQTEYNTNEEKNDLPELPPRMMPLATGTRAGEEDYLNLVWEKGHGTRIGNENSVATADVDNDGNVEIIFGNYEGHIHIIQYSNGDYVDEWKSPNLGSAAISLTTGDVDNDGIIEIIIGTSFGEIFIFGYQSSGMTYAEEWSQILAVWEIYGLATGDLDNDGINEIVAGTSTVGGTGAFPNVYVFGYDGSTYILEWIYWAEDSYSNNARTIAIGDVDSDGTNEFVVGISEWKYVTETPRGSFYIFGYNNGLYTLEWKKDDNSVDIIDIDIGNIDDDEAEEIVVGAALVDVYQYQSGVYAIETVIPESFAFIEVDDVNDDGKNEVVTGTNRISIWQENTLLWESEDFFPQEIYGITTHDSDNDVINEIIITLGEFYENPQISIFGFDGISYEEEWSKEYLEPIEAVAIGDVDDDESNEVLLITSSRELLIFGFEKGEYVIENSIFIPNWNGIVQIFIADFNNDEKTEIIVTVEDYEIYFIEFDGENYVVSYQLEIDNGDGIIQAADVGDVDNDNIIELVVGTQNGYINVIGFDGNFYDIEWRDQIYYSEISITNIYSIGIGDSDNDGTSEIAVGGYETDLQETRDILFVLGHDEGDYIQEWEYNADYSIYAIDIGDSDNDGDNETIVDLSASDLIVFAWDGTTYIEEWSSSDFNRIYDKCIDICDIEFNKCNQIVIGEEELFVLAYEDIEETYQLLWQTEGMPDGIIDIFVGDADYFTGNEILVSVGAYIFMYGTEQWPTASLSVSQNTVGVGEVIQFDGSHSSGQGILEYFFDFGDNSNTSWITNPTVTHSYSDTGTYFASLKVRDENGIESNNPAVKTINVLEPNIAPIAYIDDISPNPSTQEETVNFTGHGYDNDGTITSYSWESNIDGKLSSSDSFSSSYLSIGIHTITFKVKDDREIWSDGDAATLVINSKPENLIPIAYIDSISPNTAIEGETVTFTGHGTDDDGTIISYSWESDVDGVLGEYSSFSTSSLSLGIHTISFSVKDDNGAWSDPDTTTLTINAIPENYAPIAYIDTVIPNPAIEGEIVTFVGHGDDSDGSIVTYHWESDIDGFLSSDRSFTSPSLSVGEHIITFKVKDDKDMWSEPVSTTLIVNETGVGGGLFGGNGGDDDYTLIAILLGIVALVIIVIIATLMAVTKKKSSSDVAQVSCTGCGSALGIPSTSRPITIQCPYCGSNSVLYE